MSSQFWKYAAPAAACAAAIGIPSAILLADEGSREGDRGGIGVSEVPTSPETRAPEITPESTPEPADGSFLTHSGTHRVPLRGPSHLFVVKQTIRARGDGSPLLVGWSGGDLATYGVHAFWDGSLAERPPATEEPPLASFEGGLDAWQTTGITEDGRLVTLRGKPADGPDVARAWEWSVDVRAPIATELGTHCRQDDEVSWVPCP